MSTCIAFSVDLQQKKITGNRSYVLKSPKTFKFYRKSRDVGLPIRRENMAKPGPFCFHVPSLFSSGGREPMSSNNFCVRWRRQSKLALTVRETFVKCLVYSVASATAAKSSAECSEISQFSSTIVHHLQQHVHFPISVREKLPVASKETVVNLERNNNQHHDSVFAETFLL